MKSMIALGLVIFVPTASAQQADADLISPEWFGRQPVVSSEAPAQASESPPAASSQLQQGSGPVLRCADTLRDDTTGACLEASSIPMLGSLYPLSPDLFVSHQGLVGIGTIDPLFPLHVENGAGAHARIGTMDFGHNGWSYMKNKDAPQVGFWHGTAGDTWINSASALRLQVDNTTQLRIDSSGFLHASNYAGGGNRYLYVDDSGTMFWANTYSSRRFKHDIRDLDVEHRRILDTRPVSFLYDNEQNYYGTERVLGYVAEEFIDAGLEELVEYDAEGEPKAIRYEWIPILMLEVVKEHDRAIAELAGELEGTVARQEAELVSLRGELAELREQESERDARLTRLEAFAALNAAGSTGR